MDFEKLPLILSPWDRKQAGGATRRACAVCGVHAFVAGATTVVCTCCGGSDLRPVTTGSERPAAAIVAPVLALVRA
jgi:hypothetical protein